MSTLHPRERCVNNIISFTEQYVTPEFFELKMQGYLKKKCTTWTKFTEWLKPPKQDEIGVDVFPSTYIAGHSTSLCMFVKGGKRYVWYHNPWGFAEDRKHVMGYEDIDENDRDKINSLFRRTSADDNPDMDFLGKELSPADKLCVHATRLFLLKKMHQRGESKGEIDDKVATWRGNGDRQINVCHIMSLLYTLKCLTNSNHLEVIHPQDSMLPSGPQINDGISPLGGETISTTTATGACTLWTSLYNAKVFSTVGEDLRKRRSIAYILETIKKRVTHNFLGGEKTARLALAKFTNNDSGGYIDAKRKEDLKEVYTHVYRFIPRNDSLLFPPRTRTGTYPWSPWHRRVFRDMDKILAKVAGKSQSHFGVDITTKKDDTNNFVSTGYLEVFRILAESENSVTIPVETSMLIMYLMRKIRQHKLHSYRGLENFLAGVTAIIVCKHEEEQDSVSRPEDPYVAPATRKRVRDEIYDFHVHRDLFKGHKRGHFFK